MTSASYNLFITEFAEGVNERLSFVEKNLYELGKYILERCEEGERLFGKSKREIFDDLCRHPAFKYSKVTLYGYRQTAEFLEQLPEEIIAGDNIPFNNLAEVAKAKLPQEIKEKVVRQLKPNQTRREIRQLVKETKRELELAKVNMNADHPDFTFKVGDFRHLGREIPDSSVDLIFTDPPYSNEYLELWEDLGKLAGRVLRPGGFLLTYSGQAYLPEVLNSLSSPLQYFWTACVLLGGGNRQIFAQRVVNQWKPILIYGKSPLKIQDWWLDFIKQRLDKTFHEWQQDADVARYYIRMFSPPGGVVLDPMVGSGSTAVACLLEKRKCIAFDSDEEAVETARRRLCLTSEKLKQSEAAGEMRTFPEGIESGASIVQ